MTRDPDRIRRMLDLVEDIWTRYPDMRLGQLIGNAIGEADAYYVEDDVLEVELNRLYGKLSAND